jgi:hypothetical protein
MHSELKAATGRASRRATERGVPAARRVRPAARLGGQRPKAEFADALKAAKGSCNLSGRFHGTKKRFCSADTRNRGQAMRTDGSGLLPADGSVVDGVEVARRAGVLTGRGGHVGSGGGVVVTRFPRDFKRSSDG